MKKHFFIVILAIAALCSCQRELTVVSYNVGTFSKYGYDSTADVAEMLISEGADVVGLCELDSCTTRTGRTNQIEELRKLMPQGWQAFFSKAMNFQGGAYGIGILLSPEYKALNSYTIELPKAGGPEDRVACVVETRDFVYVVTHLDHSSEDARLAQAVVLNSALVYKYKDSKKPVILCGDFNASPDSREITFMSYNWKRISPLDLTFSTEKPEECIDYIFLLKNEAAKEVQYIGSTILDTPEIRRASDHFPILSTVQF